MKPSIVWESIDQYTGRDEYVDYVESGGDIYFIDPDSNWTFLHKAVEFENYALIDLIIENGFDPDFSPSGGYPAIFQALDGDIDVAIQCDKTVRFKSTRHLIEKGASVHVCDVDGKSLAEYAESYGVIFKKAYEAMIYQMSSQA